MRSLLGVLIVLFVAGCSTGNPEVQNTGQEQYDPSKDTLRFPGELHLRNIR